LSCQHLQVCSTSAKSGHCNLGSSKPRAVPPAAHV
jgi:hypothetical protein